MELNLGIVRPWTMKNVNKLDVMGECDYDTQTIRIRRGQSEHERLDTVTHELVHAVFPDMEESIVSLLSRTISDTLWKDGWRRKTKT